MLRNLSNFQDTEIEGVNFCPVPGRRCPACLEREIEVFDIFFITFMEGIARLGIHPEFRGF